jgi:hypothetical protein
MRMFLYGCECFMDHNVENICSFMDANGIGAGPLGTPAGAGAERRNVGASIGTYLEACDQRGAREGPAYRI